MKVKVTRRIESGGVVMDCAAEAECDEIDGFYSEPTEKYEKAAKMATALFESLPKFTSEPKATQ